MTRDLRAKGMAGFAKAMAGGARLLVPVGSTEAQGPHLPPASAMLRAEYVCAAVAQTLGLLDASPTGGAG